MNLESMVKVAVRSLYASIIAIVFGLILGMLGKLVTMMIFIAIGIIGISVFEIMSDRIDHWYAINEDEKY